MRNRKKMKLFQIQITADQQFKQWVFLNFIKRKISKKYFVYQLAKGSQICESSIGQIQLASSHKDISDGLAALDEDEERVKYRHFQKLSTKMKR